MDWLQFTSSIIGALAWPLAAIGALILVRKHFGPLLQRLTHLKVPGMAEAKFKEHLAASTEEAEEVALQTRIQPESRAAPDKAFLELAKNFPSAAILQSWKDIEAILQNIRERLPGMQSRHRFESVVRRLVDQKLIDGSVEKLYQSLRQARNTAVHATDAGNISQGEVLEYRDRVATLSSIFQGVLDRLPPRSTLGLASA
jgi:hypothetical protein